jgi:hypothetical protein
MSIPYIGFGNDTLADCPPVKEGDEIHCPRCNGRHWLECALQNGQKTDLLMFYHCGEGLYLGAVGGRLVVHAKADCGGTLEGDCL